jgi:hypothetical protein
MLGWFYNLQLKSLSYGKTIFIPMHCCQLMLQLMLYAHVFWMSVGIWYLNLSVTSLLEDLNGYSLEIVTSFVNCTEQLPVSLILDVGCTSLCTYFYLNIQLLIFMRQGASYVVSILFVHCNILSFSSISSDVYEYVDYRSWIGSFWNAC